MKRNKFSLSNYKMLSCNQGELVPIGLTEVLPGDTVQHATNAFIRVAPLLSPVMHPVEAKIHHWFVPHRLVWDDWENFITAGPNGTSTPVFPTITMPGGGVGAAVGSLADYLGVPTGVASLVVSALPFRGYAMIFNHFYRDQDLVTAAALSTASGADATTSTAIKNAAWEKDYFTSARPWEQKGPAVSLPLTGNAPVVTTNAQVRFKGMIGAAESGMSYYTTGLYGPDSAAGLVNGEDMAFGSNTGLQADMSGVTAATVNDLRLAMALQRYEEARARYGSRYVEYLRYLGVKSSDARLQLPEYLGGGKQTIQFSEVLQTAEGTDPVGEMRGHGIASMRSNRYRRFFEEHGYVFSFLVVRPKSVYAQGLQRTWNRRTKEDFWQREFEHIGQQEVLNKEIYAPHASPDGVFGYQDRYDEYRRSESTVAGEFRTSLNYWHMAQIYGATPALNASFVTAVPTTRIYADAASDQLYVMARHSIQARRLVAKTGHSYIY